MDSQEREYFVVIPSGSAEPEIGRWLWALQECRERTLRELAHVSPAMVDWLPPNQASSIGTILYHLTDIEADWLYAEVLERPMPAELLAAFTFPTRDTLGHLTPVVGITLQEHQARLASVRRLVLDVYGQMTMSDFRRVRSLANYDVTPEWVLHHLMQHEAEHRGQLGSLRTLAEQTLGVQSK